jgi:ATP-binding cassette subfamily F protein 3
MSILSRRRLPLVFIFSTGTIMLTVQNISKSFGIEKVLSGVSFTLNSGERLGLVGPNGCGKTTLLRILTGLDRPDSGSIHFDPPALNVGYLQQGFQPGPGETLGGFLQRMEGDLPGLSARLEQLAGELAYAPDQRDLQHDYDAVLARLQAASENAGRGPSVLAALGLDHLPLGLPAAALSGGQKTRLGLAGILLSSPQLLLLDEPTNHLDLDMLDWLEDWLLAFRHAALVVSHDRAFLDHTATGILELNPVTHAVRLYDGNYSCYLEAKNEEWERHKQDYSDQQAEIAQLQAAAAHLRGLAKFKKGGKADGGDKFAKGFFANRSKGTVGRAKHIEQRLEHLLTEERIDKPRSSWQMKLEFNESLPSGRDVLVLEDLAVGYGEAALLAGLNQTVRYGERLVLLGPNGSGKTTLLRTIAGLIPALAGSAQLGSNVRLGYMAQEQEDLDPALNAFETIRRQAALSETDARAFLSFYLFTGDDVFIPAGKLSYGERARLSLACLVARGCNFLMLDEPINHLDIPSRARFEQALAQFEGTILAVVHDRYFIDGFASEIWQVVEKGLVRYPRGD